MTTDITELAQREKFEAWARSQQLSLAYADCGYAYSSTEMAWRAVKALSAELVEALEKAQAKNALVAGGIEAAAELHERIAELEKGHNNAAKRIISWRRLAKQSIAELEKGVADLDGARQRIAELESRTVTVKLPKPISVLHRRELSEAHCAIYVYPEAEVNAALDDSGIKWEAE
ncbi:hypothetical protein GOY59_01930 [Klebsiella pneumoniae]|uniref:hypothetical protein n=1 Tax=Klebsiella pneumoniae TaxID=573 RepID=UPI001FAB7D09|nr:hypothetical protein [Klebsiella pneumoniae]MCI7949273.1 hypothetical protein [Klebsiella pneumoniae]